MRAFIIFVIVAGISTIAVTIAKKTQLPDNVCIGIGAVLILILLSGSLMLFINKNKD